MSSKCRICLGVMPKNRTGVEQICPECRDKKMSELQKPKLKDMDIPYKEIRGYRKENVQKFYNIGFNTCEKMYDKYHEQELKKKDAIIANYKEMEDRACISKFTEQQICEYKDREWKYIINSKLDMVEDIVNNSHLSKLLRVATKVIHDPERPYDTPEKELSNEIKALFKEEK